MSAHGRQEEGQDQARGLHMRCRQSARAWGLQARAYLRGAPPGPRAHGAVPRGTHGGAGIMAGAQGTAPGPQRWPDAICSHHLDCSWGSLRGQNRLILRAIWGEWQRLTCLPVVHEDKGKVAQDDQAGCPGCRLETASSSRLNSWREPAPRCPKIGYACGHTAGMSGSKRSAPKCLPSNICSMGRSRAQHTCGPDDPSV